MKEIWKDIDGYNGLYQISNLGNIKSLNNYHKKGEHLLKPKLQKNGYLEIGLWKDNIKKFYLVHRLVAKAFLSTQDDKTYVNHKNENKIDNRVENLEWCDMRYNNMYGTRIERTKKALYKMVGKYSLDGKLLKVYKSLSDACSDNNIKSKSNITCACKGIYKQSYGYMWKYIKEGGDAICQ